MGWKVYSIWTQSNYSEGEGWHTGMHSVFQGEPIGRHIKWNAEVTSVPCTVVVGFLGDFGGVQYVLAEKVIRLAKGARRDYEEWVYGTWDPHGLSPCTRVAILNYVYDLETTTRKENLDKEVFHVAEIPPPSFSDLHAQWR